LLGSELRDYVRSMISSKGYSPSSFTCFSYGGAGPVHTYGYTEGLGFEDVIVPAWAAGFSAVRRAAGGFGSPCHQSPRIPLPQEAADAHKQEQVAQLNDAWQELAHRVLEEFALNGYSADQVTLQPGFRMQ